MQGVYNIHGGKFGDKLGQSGNRFWKSALSFGNSTRMHFLWSFKMKQLLMINGETWMPHCKCKVLWKIMCIMQLCQFSPILGGSISLQIPCLCLSKAISSLSREWCRKCSLNCNDVISIWELGHFPDQRKTGNVSHEIHSRINLTQICVLSHFLWRQDRDWW